MSSVFVFLLIFIYYFLNQMMNEHSDAWPFREPVDARDVPDYYHIIKDPMGFVSNLARGLILCLIFIKLKPFD